VCSADVLPRKELFETWEAALVITEAFGDSLKGAGPAGDGEDRSATRVADLAGGHGFLALALLVLNPTLASAVVVDRRKPDSHERLVSSLAKAFPKLRLHARARFVEASVADADVKNATRVVFASVHACGDLSDAILALAVEARAPVALVPCCHRGLGSARRLAKRLDDAMLRTRTDGDARSLGGEERKRKRLAERRRRRGAFRDAPPRRVRRLRGDVAAGDHAAEPRDPRRVRVAM
jgi:hypothetical protein